MGEIAIYDKEVEWHVGYCIVHGAVLLKHSIQIHDALFLVQWRACICHLYLDIMPYFTLQDYDYIVGVCIVSALYVYLTVHRLFGCIR